MLFEILVTVAVIVILYHVIKLRNNYNKFKTITDQTTPLGPHHFLWGHLHLFSDAKGYFDLTLKLVETTKTKLYSTWMMFFYPIITTCHPDTAKLLLKSSEPKSKFYTGDSYRLVMPWIGDGLLVSSGRKWERNRRLLTPAFHFDILKPYVQEYNEAADKLLVNIKNDMAKEGSVQIYDLVSLATLDTMLKCSLSYDGRVQESGEDHPYVNAVKQLAALILQRAIAPWLYPDFIYYNTPAGWEFRKLCNFVHDFADKIIASRKEALKQDSGLLTKRRLDFLDILLTAKDEAGEGLPSEDIRAEVDTFLFEGHDTTASAISWAIYCLGKYPEEQEKLYTEVNEINSDRNRFEWDDILKAKKMTAFLKEVMRMYTTVPQLSRCLTKPMVIDGVAFPAQSRVDINLYAVHHHPDVWPDHEKFLPERFEDEAFQDRDPYSYIPFSAGSRNCIGQQFALNEQRVIIARLLKRYKIQLVPGHHYDILPEMVMRAKYGIKVKFEER